jgi:hypothetical protein
MTETNTIGFPEAARSLGVSLRVLRQAIRRGAIEAPKNLTATASLSSDWLAATQEAVKAKPGALKRTAPPKTPPFAHYKGTSAWRKYKTRVRDYATYLAAKKN